METSITTNRLLIEPLAITDNTFILELVNSKGWLEFIGDRNVHSEDDAVAYIQKINDNPNVMYWVVRFKDNSTPAGVITFIKRDYLDHHDIGFAFLPAFANNGYAYEASKAVLSEAVKNSAHSYILATTMATNGSSIKLLEKLGLQFDKEIEVNDEKLQLYSISTDKLYISEITKTFFAVFTNKNKKQPGFDELNRICIPEVMLIRKENEDVSVYNLTTFIEPRKKILFDGTLSEFEENETYQETKVINNIAQRYSEYEKSGILDNKAFKQEGYKFLQFIKNGNQWKISSVIWEDKKGSHPA
ncbi:MAG: GNAT family N-acetyltransferase [Ferruginibacter sp.]